MLKIKFFLCGIVCALSVVITFAQTERGNFLIGGELFVSNTKETYAPYSGSDFKRIFSCYVNPAVSYFVANNFSIGISTQYSYEEQYESVRGSSNPTEAFSIGPVFRYYVPIKSWAFFGETSFTYEWKIRSRLYPIRQKENLSSKLGVGATYFLNRHVGIEGLVFYLYRKDMVGYGPDKSYHLNESTINFRIGVQVYLGRKNKTGDQ